jgi:hypothetical protein
VPGNARRRRRAEDRARSRGAALRSASGSTRRRPGRHRPRRGRSGADRCAGGTARLRGRQRFRHGLRYSFRPCNHALIETRLRPRARRFGSVSSAARLSRRGTPARAAGQGRVARRGFDGGAARQRRRDQQRPFRARSGGAGGHAALALDPAARRNARGRHRRSAVRVPPGRLTEPRVMLEYRALNL